ncbi:MAG: 2-vinyl bacteriochlorophyllide hydratase, partial [Pseudomonadota bacterium]
MGHGSSQRAIQTPATQTPTAARPHNVQTAASSHSVGLYTAEERQRRDETIWTLVQGILAPVQFVVFLISLGLVLVTLTSGDYYALTTASIVIKTLILYTIMVTGAIWEKVVFGRYLFAPAFFWEDVFSMLVLALHTAYLMALWTQALSPTALLWLALAAYAAYVINAVQFVLKLRAARLQAAAADGDVQRQATSATTSESASAASF